MRAAITIAVCLAIAGLLWACSTRPVHKPVSAAARPQLLVTITPLKLILDPLVKGRADVAVLLRPGDNAHTYEVRPADAAACAKSTALFYVGGDFDAWAAQLDAPCKIAMLELLPAAMRLKAFILPHQPAPGAAPGRQLEPAAGSGYDPHFFTDPLAVKAMLPALVDQLSALDPAGTAQYSINAAAFATQLDLLHAKIAAQLQPVQGQAVLLMHPSFAYFMARYRLRLAGVVEEFPGKEPSPRYLQELAAAAKQSRARAILTETLLPPEPAQALAEATQLRLGELDPSCGGTRRQYKDYRDWLLYNSGILLKALQP